ncbi:MAG: EscU/YscU/HrcU family type III secretion system export apparatus switch protein [Kofleriaceae bacterium]
MSGSLPPTAARRREFRDRGELARSRDAVAAAALVGAVAALFVTAPASWAALERLLADALRGAEPGASGHLAARALGVAVWCCAPVLAAAFVAAALATGAQLGWPPALRWPRRDRRAPRPGALARALGPAPLGRRVVTTVAKLLAVGAVLRLCLDPDLALRAHSAASLRASLAELCGATLVLSAFAFAALGLADYALARLRLETRLKMTPAELRREIRDQEGDPAIKARRQRRARRAAAAAGGTP